MKTILLFMAIALSLCTGYSQSICGNLDFENGNFDNWKTYVGTTYNIDHVSVQGFDSSRFVIMSDGYDPMTGFALSFVAPGGSYSCRLGNSNNGAEAEKMTYSLNVNENNALFIYRYAIVLEDPGHNIEDQPQFEVKILDGNGLVTDQTCGYYQVSAAANIPGFQSYGYVVYKDWTTVGIDLSPYLGQTVTICFITKDCSLGGHFGYAYIDAESSKMEIGTYACAGNDSIVMAAPLGFDYLWQPTGYTGRVLSVTASTAEESYSCTLTSVTGCSLVLTTSTEIIEVFPDFNYLSCDTVRFLGTSLDNSPDIVAWNWDFGDGQVGTGNNPLHLFGGAGPFDVQLTVTSNRGCKAVVTKPVLVALSPEAIVDPSLNCAGLACKIGGKSLRVIDGVTRYFWDFGDGSYSNEAIPDKRYEIPGKYIVSLTLVNGPDCEDKVKSELEIYNCEVQLPNVVTPNADGLNDNFIIKNLEACSDKKLSIFNRWGTLVYSSGMYCNTWHPKELSTGVYYYVFEYSPLYPKDLELAKTGFVTILK